MKQTKHQPGLVVNRQFNNYNAFQDALWEAFDDFYYADVGGYGNTRMPTPGKAIEPVNSYNLDFNDWKNTQVSITLSILSHDRLNFFFLFSVLYP